MVSSDAAGRARKKLAGYGRYEDLLADIAPSRG
jgi:hypothetical protein